MEKYAYIYYKKQFDNNPLKSFYFLIYQIKMHSKLKKSIYQDKGSQ